jgi:hypothetical protein
VQGTVYSFDANVRTGLVEDARGLRYFFRCLSLLVVPKVGTEVEFDPIYDGHRRTAVNLKFVNGYARTKEL